MADRLKTVMISYYIEGEKGIGVFSKTFDISTF